MAVASVTQTVDRQLGGVPVPWFAAGALVAAGLALVYLRRYERRGWRSTGTVLLVVLLVGLVARLAPSAQAARAAGFGFLAGAFAAAAGWGLVRARRKARAGGPTGRPGAGAGG